MKNIALIVPTLVCFLGVNAVRAMENSGENEDQLLNEAIALSLQTTPSQAEYGCSKPPSRELPPLPENDQYLLDFKNIDSVVGTILNIAQPYVTDLQDFIAERKNEQIGIKQSKSDRNPSKLKSQKLKEERENLIVNNGAVNNNSAIINNNNNNNNNNNPKNYRPLPPLPQDAAENGDVPSSNLPPELPEETKSLERKRSKSLELLSSSKKFHERKRSNSEPELIRIKEKSSEEELIRIKEKRTKGLQKKERTQNLAELIVLAPLKPLIKGPLSQNELYANNLGSEVRQNIIEDILSKYPDVKMYLTQQNCVDLNELASDDEKMHLIEVSNQLITYCNFLLKDIKRNLRIVLKSTDEDVISQNVKAGKDVFKLQQKINEHYKKDARDYRQITNLKVQLEKKKEESPLSEKLITMEHLTLMKNRMLQDLDTLINNINNNAENKTRKDLMVLTENIMLNFKNFLNQGAVAEYLLRKDLESKKMKSFEDKPKTL